MSAQLPLRSTLRAFVVTVEPINCPPRTRTFYGKARSVIRDAADWGRDVAKACGHSPLSLSVTVRAV